MNIWICVLVNRNVTVLSLNFAKAVETLFLTPPDEMGFGGRNEHYS